LKSLTLSGLIPGKQASSQFEERKCSANIDGDTGIEGRAADKQNLHIGKLGVVDATSCHCLAIDVLGYTDNI
jgi:hypothetical protein